MGKIAKNKIGIMKKFNSWSYSAWVAYSTCPHSAMLGRLHKLCPTCFYGTMKGFPVSRCDSCGFAKPMNAAMQRGDEIHRKAEAYLKGRTKGLPTELEKFAGEFRQLKRLNASAEEDWTITFDEEFTSATDWERAWLRCKIDANVFVEPKALVIIDYKTGRFNPVPEQGELYASVALIKYPNIEEVTVEFWFLDQSKTTDITYKVNEIKALWEKWRSRAMKMCSDKVFDPRPGDHCNKCPYRSSVTSSINGRKGPCLAWKRQ